MDKNYKIYEADLEADFREDPRNANKGTERGHKLLERSVEKFGAARSMVADADGFIPAGNKTREALIAAGIRKAVVVETDGNTPVIVKRTDWKLTEERNPAREYAYADNRVAEVNLEWDHQVLAIDMIEMPWCEFMPEQSKPKELDKSILDSSIYSVSVECHDESMQAKVAQILRDNGFSPKLEVF